MRTSARWDVTLIATAHVQVRVIKLSKRRVILDFNGERVSLTKDEQGELAVPFKHERIDG
jgi:hypothetical protein